MGRLQDGNRKQPWNGVQGKNWRQWWIVMIVLTLLAGMNYACSDEDPVKEDTENNDDNNKNPEEEENNNTENKGTTEDEKVNKLVFDFLSDYYLWNDAYKAQTLDFTLDYQTFFEKGIMNLKVNTLDVRPYETTDGYGNTVTKYTHFSYIQEIPDYTTTRAAYEKEKEMSFGFFGFYLFVSKKDKVSGDDYVSFLIKGVYPDSPAANAGLDRGYILETYNGKDIRLSNYLEVFSAIMYPTTSTTVTVAGYTSKNGVDSATKSYTLTSEAIALNPILKAQTEQVGTHKVGYLCYASFEAGFDQELLNEFKKFKSEGITDLVIDLRYNHGGYVVSANLMATCVAGTQSDNKVFAEYRYNDTRMKALGNQRPQEMFGQKLSLTQSIADGKLNLSKVYILTGAESASSSELVINALRGIDVEVYLIGQNTTGKNVGMEVMRIGKNESKGKDLEKTYEIAPITFQSYNAKGFGDYQDGFKPDMVVDETNPFNMENYLFIYRPFGSQEEYLYGFALEKITGQTIIQRPSNTRSVVETSATVPVASSRRLTAPLPRKGGMIKMGVNTELTE